MKKSNSKVIFIIILAIIAVIAIVSFIAGNNQTEVEFSTFKGLISEIGGEDADNDGIDYIKYFEKHFKTSNVTAVTVSEVEFENYAITYKIVYTHNAVYGKNTETLTCVSYYSRATDSVGAIEDALDKAQISYSYTDPNAGAAWSYIFPIIMMAVGILVVFLFLKASGGGTKGALNFAKTNAKLNTNVKTRFTDVAGAEEEKEELKEIVDFLKFPKKFQEIGARVPKGVLLVGPPGTGKTLFAKAVAGEAGVPFYSISGSDFVEMFVGVGASRVRDLFDVAKKTMPCIVFIDEIDAVGRQRGTGLGGGNDEKEQTLNQLLVEMDGFDKNDGIIIMAATNRADILDPALLRPGRFDRQIYVHTPDVKGREAILKVHARNKPLADNVNLKIVARMTSGFSGADLENLLNEAAILAARANRKVITNKDLYEGINKVLIGPQKKSRLVTETDKRITAYHEAGHAILAKLLPNCDPVQEVSIIPRGQAAGYTMTRPDNDDTHITKNKLLDDIVMTLGGRVAEELIIKDVSAGASGDIQAITKRARAMVTEWGMSEKLGPVALGSDREVFIGRDMASHVTYSEQTAALIDAEVKEIIENALAKARDLLKANKNLLDTMARVLVERETIYTEEVNMIMDGKSAEEVFDFMDKNEEALMEKPFERGNANIESENSSIETIANFESEPKVEENTNENTDVEQKSDERYDENAPKEEN